LKTIKIQQTVSKSAKMAKQSVGSPFSTTLFT